MLVGGPSAPCSSQPCTRLPPSPPSAALPELCAPSAWVRPTSALRDHREGDTLIGDALGSGARRPWEEAPIQREEGGCRQAGEGSSRSGRRRRISADNHGGGREFRRERTATQRPGRWTGRLSGAQGGGPLGWAVTEVGQRAAGGGGGSALQRHACQAHRSLRPRGLRLCSPDMGSHGGFLHR